MTIVPNPDTRDAKCHATEGPPCDRLISDPSAVLADPDAWPRHYCRGVAKASTKRWAYARIEEQYGDLSAAPPEALEWAGPWPLLVGKRPNAGSIPMHLLPFPLSVKAAIIFEQDVRMGSVIAFAMVDDHPTVRLATNSTRNFLPITMQFIVMGWTSEEMNEFQRRAERWWEGNRATGRNRGRLVSPKDAVGAYRAFKSRMGRPPTQLEVAGELGCSDRALRKTVTWNELKHMAESQERYAREQERYWRELVADLTRSTGKKPG